MAKKQKTRMFHGIEEDEDTIAMIEAYERGELAPVKNQARVKKMLQEAARTHLQKQARINIRLSNSDLAGLRYKAQEEGLPYQTLIASVLHKYVTGRLVPKGE